MGRWCTERLELRRWQPDDLEAFFAIYRQWEVARWLGALPRSPVSSREEARERMARWEQRAAGLGEPLGFWAIVPAGSDDQPVGTVLLMPLQDEAGLSGEIEIGWHLHPARQRQGLATDAARLLLRAARAAGIARVRAVTDLDNVRSQPVATRLGMTDIGVTDRWFGLLLREYVWSDDDPDGQAQRDDRSDADGDGPPTVEGPWPATA